jgi:rubrerythrin
VINSRGKKTLRSREKLDNPQKATYLGGKGCFGENHAKTRAFRDTFPQSSRITPFETKSLLELEKQFICVDAMMTVVALSFIFLPIGIVLIIIIALLVVGAFRSRRDMPQSRQLLDTQQQVVGEEMAKKEAIVKVRCSYCGNQFDETLDKCPYCGAKH